MKHCLALLATALLFLFAGEAARPDHIILGDGKEFPNARVDSFSQQNGRPVFQARARQDGELTEPYPLDAATIHQIAFTGADGELGRPAEIVMNNGSEPSRVSVLNGGAIEEGFVINVIPADSAPDADPVSVNVSEIQSLTFIEPEQTPSEETRQTPTPSPEPPAEDQQDPQQQQPADTQTEADDSEAPDGSGASAGGGTSTGGTSPGGGGTGILQETLSTGASTAMLIGLIIGNVALSVLFNAIIIFLVIKVESIPGVGMKHALLCAVYLSILPIVCIPLLCIPFFGGIIYLVGVIFFARAIVMGTLEVLEGQAWVILILWIIFTFAASWLLSQMSGVEGGLF